jgi:predicted outer membrane protein
MRPWTHFPHSGSALSCGTRRPILRLLNRFPAPGSSVLSGFSPDARDRYQGKKEMRSYKPAALLAILMQAVLLMLSGCSPQLDSNKFLEKAMQDGMAEIQISHLALTKSADDDVKKFAQRMIEDHSQIDREIAQLVKERKANLPQEITTEQKVFQEELSRLSGYDFDKTFMDHNVRDHEQDIKDFREQSEKGSDAGVKAFASRTLPVLETHLQLSKGVEVKVQP